ncbi:hypothetical protein D3C85_1654580 [compost metagenome]
MEVLAVQGNHQLPEVVACRNPGRNADPNGGEPEAKVLEGDSTATVAERLEQADLGALNGHKSAQQRVQEE